MLQEYVNSPCPICSDQYIKNVSQNGLILEIDCERCGKYKIGRRLLDDKPWQDVRHFVSAWVRRENKAGITPNIGGGASLEDAINPEWWKTQYRSMGFPTTTIDKLNKLLQVVAENIDGEYDKQFSLGLPYYTSEIAAKMAMKLMV